MYILQLINDGYIIRKLPATKTTNWIEYKDRPLKEDEQWVKTTTYNAKLGKTFVRYSVLSTQPAKNLANKFMVTRSLDTGSTIQFGTKTSGIGDTIEEALADYESKATRPRGFDHISIVKEYVSKYGE